MQDKMPITTPQSLGLLASLRVFAAHYRRAPLQAGAILLGILLAVTLLTGVQATNDNAKRSYRQATELLSGRATWLLTPPAGQSNLDEAVYFNLRQGGMSDSLAVLYGEVTDSRGQRLEIESIDIVAAINWQLRQKSIPSGSDEMSGQTRRFPELPLARLLGAEPLVLMSRSLAAELAPNGIITLETQTLTVQPMDDELGLGSAILMDISLAQRLLQLPGRLSYIALLGKPAGNTEQLTAHLQSLGIAPDSARLEPQDQGQALASLTHSFHLNLDAMAKLAFVVGLFIAYNAARYSLLKRQKLLVQLMQLGITRRALMLALILELLLLVLAGTTLGFILGLQLSHWLQPMVSMTLEQIYGARLLPGSWQAHWFVQALALTTVAALCVCIPLYRQLTTQSLVLGTVQPSQERRHALIHRGQFMLACLLLPLVLLLMPLSRDYEHSLLLLGALVIALPLLLPQCLHWGAALLTPLMPPGLWHYLVSETRELIPPLSLAMMAILLALCANVAMTTLIGSFEHTLRNWLDERLRADLYLRPNSQQMNAVLTSLEGDPKVRQLLRQWNQKATLMLDGTSLPVTLSSRDDASVRTVSVLKQQTADFWPQFFQGKQVMVNEPLAVKFRLELGDRILLDALPSTDAPPTLGAVYYDHGSTRPELLIDQTLWQGAALSALPTSLGILYDGDLSALEQKLSHQTGLTRTQMYRQTDIKAQALILFERTFAITAVLNSLTLLVAAIGLFSACVMLTQAREAPLARLYALGVSRRQLRSMVLLQMLLVVSLTCALALPGGTLLGYLLTERVTLQAFGWSIAMHWDWPALAKALLTAIIACLVAVALPLYWQTRRPLIASLQRETL